MLLLRWHLLLLLLLPLILFQVHSQSPSFRELYIHSGTDQWSDATQASPVFYENPTTGDSYIVGATYWDLYCVNAATGESLWIKDTYDMTPGTPGNLESRFETGVVMVESFREEGDVAFIVGCDNTQVSVWDVEGNMIGMTRVDERVGRRVRGISAAKISEELPWRILVGLPSTNMGRYPNVWILDPFLLGTTAAVPLANSPEGANSLGVFSKNIAAADLDGSGTLEVIVPSDDYSVAVWRVGDLSHPSTQYPVNEVFYNAENMWSRVIFSRDYVKEFRGWSNSSMDYKPFFAHGVATVIPVELFATGFASAGRTEPIIAISGLYNWGFDRTGGPWYQYNTVFLLNPDRTRLNHGSWDWRLSYEGCSDRLFEDGEHAAPCEIEISYADLTGDGLPEIIFPCADGKIHAVRLDQSPVPGFPYDLGGTPDRRRYASEVVLFERTSDSGPVLAFTTWGPSDETPFFYGQMIMLSHTGTLIEAYDLPGPIRDECSGSKTGLSLFRFSSGSSNLHAAVQTLGSGLCVYEIENTADAQVLWRSNRGSFERNGALEVPHAFVAPPDRGIVATIFGGVAAGILGAVAVAAIIVVLVVSFCSVLCCPSEADRKGKSKTKK